MPHTTKYRARWLFPIDAPPLENGTVEIESGLITAIHNRPEPSVIDLGNVALLPALINCHTHLEFSSLTEPFTPSLPFTSWIKSLVAFRRELPAPPLQAIESGLRESLENGVSLVGEIATSDWPLPLSKLNHPSLVLFREAIGRTPEQQQTQLKIAQRHLDLNGTSTTKNFGLSPHAPYSVHPDLLRDLVSLAIEDNAPLAMHLAETQAELELLKSGTGELADMLRQFGAFDPTLYDNSRTILDDLRQLARSSNSLVIHGNYLTKTDIDFIAAHPQLSVICCPRTHHFFRHTPHPWQELLSRGINVALGTDGRGSNPDLSIWNELRFLAQNFPEFPRETLLKLPTLNAARALGHSRLRGSITPGKLAELIQIPLSDTAKCSSPCELLFNSPVVMRVTPLQ